MPATARSTHLAIVLAGAAVVLGGATVARRLSTARATPTPAVLAGFTERDVRVEIAFEEGRGGESWLRARFTPTRPGFRLYAKELPRGGLSGIGRPTLLELVAGLRATGPLHADRVAGEIRSDLLGLRFPVYPAGSVTLSLPVTRTPNDAGAAELSLTYMACSERTCMPPVIDRRVRVRVPPAAGS